MPRPDLRPYAWLLAATVLIFALWLLPGNVPDEPIIWAPAILVLGIIFVVARLYGRLQHSTITQHESERRLAEQYEALKSAQMAQQRLVAIVESSDDAIVGKDLNGVITTWNLAAERLFGYTAAEIVGQSMRRVIPGERQSEEDDILARVRAGRRVEHFETVRMRKDGSLVDVSVSVSPIRDVSGVIVGASSITRDITEWRRAERMRTDLLERERRALVDAVAARDRVAFLAEISALLSSSLDYQETLDRAVHLALPRLGDYCNVLVQDERGVLKHVAWGHVVREKEPVLRELARRLVEAPATPRVRTFSDEVLESGRTLVVSHEALVAAAERVAPSVDPDLVAMARELRPYAFVGVPLLVGGRALGVLSFGTSEQESKREYAASEVELVEEFARRAAPAIENARLFRRADELNRFKDEFLATLSHELRTPLAAILGWSRMLGGGQLDPAKTSQAVEAIERNAQAQAKIVDDVLDVARGMSGNLRLELETVDLAEVARRGVDAVAPAASAKQITIAVTARAPVTVTGDAARLQQVVWNLVSNAVKFTPAGGRVDVETAEADGHAELRVTDTGMGIPAAFLPFVFDKFRQADGSATRQHGGLGLGLAIARHITELHGGTIAAASEGEGRGATFIVRLPLVSAAASAEPASSTARPAIK